MFDWKKFVEADPRSIQSKLPYVASEKWILSRAKVILPKSLVQGKNILDLGCGIPYFGKWVLENGAESYTGVEYQKEIAEKAQTLLPEANIINLDVEQYVKFNDLSKFDTIICCSVLQTIPNVNSIFKKLFSHNPIIVFESDNHIPNDWAQILLSDGHQNTENYGETETIEKWKVNFKGLEKIVKLHNYSIDDAPFNYGKIVNPKWYGPQKYCCWLKPIEAKIVDNGTAWKFDNRVANSFNDHAKKHIPDYEYIINLTKDIIKDNFKKESSILEIGCALGKTVQCLNGEGFFNVTATESSKEMIENLPFLKGNVIHTDQIPNEKFDSIICNWTLHFVKEKETFLKKMIDSLNPGGMLIISEKTTECNKTLYYSWKKRQGCTQDEIDSKERQLNGVMVLDDIEWYESLFRQFDMKSQIINKKLGFVTWLVQK